MNRREGFKIGQWQVWPERNLLSSDSDEVQVNARTMDVLCHLAEHAGEVVSREECNEAVWADAVVTDYALTGCISELRQALGDDRSAPRFIETIPKRGYRLAMPVEPLAEATDLPDGRTGRSTRPWILAAILLAVVSAAAWYAHQSDAPTPQTAQPTLAVLPFVAIGVQPELPLAEGIHHDLVIRLSEQNNLRVISPRSVRRFRDTELSISEIAAELGVNWIVEATVQQTAQEFQVNVQLTEAPDDALAWGRRYHHQLSAERLFAVQDEIIEDIVESVYIHLEPEGRPRPGRAPTENLEAYTRYVQARTSLEARTESAMRRAAGLFRAASEVDPDYALALVGLADTLTLLHDYGYAGAEEVLGEARSAINRALELDPDLAEAHASLGLYHGTRRQMAEAVAALQRAVKLRPGYAEAHNWLSWFLSVVGEGEAALESGRQAAELDPMSAEALVNHALGHIATGEYEQVLEPASRARQLQPDYTTAPLYEAWALYHLDRFKEARDLLEGLRAEWAGAVAEATLALVHLRLDHPGRAEELLVEIASGQDRFAEGLVLAAMGETEAAFRAWKRVDSWGYGPALVVHHLFPEVLDPLQADPRFEAMIEEIRTAFGWNDPG